MVKRKGRTRKKYKNKLLIRALNAETRVKVLHDAAVRCMRDRDDNIRDLKATVDGLHAILAILINESPEKSIKFSKKDYFNAGQGKGEFEGLDIRVVEEPAEHCVRLILGERIESKIDDIN